MQSLENFQKRFELKTHTVFSTEHWVVSVRPRQITVGSMVVSLKRECYFFSQVTPTELSDLSGVYGYVESVLSERFGAVKFNYLALMLVDDILHFHVIPRYDEDVTCFGHQYTDQYWPGPVDIAGAVDVDVLKLVDMLKLSV